MGQAQRVTGLVHRDREERRVRHAESRVGAKRQGDRGLTDPSRMIPGQIGLSGTIEVEVVDPAHHDVRVGAVGYGS